MRGRVRGDWAWKMEYQEGESNPPIQTIQIHLRSKHRRHLQPRQFNLNTSQRHSSHLHLIRVKMSHRSSRGEHHHLATGTSTGSFSVDMRPSERFLGVIGVGGFFDDITVRYRAIAMEGYGWGA